ncbi:O-antigen ligase family protein [Floccifex sp.]|uniref:O-antigen ligase family protein n=1 Tax=Floccifex sp. TaxID=2815810 RepID=UPI002A752CC3|nr:O-antigen ligase family protein [Floccifex sp.]MDD7281947.1 O-antigen ligase family protein [Erysipelotrichaceae bacterium]MDY2959106.1 O-antigen ligase family protein [Floccifex sp.]
MLHFKSRFSSLSEEEKLIFVSFFLLFMNIFIHAICIVGIVIYAYRKKELKADVKKMPGAKYLLLLTALSFVVSVFYKNLYGIGIAIGLFFVFLYISFVRQHLNKNLFGLIIEMMIWMSLFINLVGLAQFWNISRINDYSFFTFHIFNSPKRRISSTFLNANYYAMMLEFLITCCMFRFVQVKKWKEKAIYVVIGLFDFFMLYLTGCRAALLPFVVMVPVFLFFSKEYKWSILSIICIVLAIGIIIYDPSLIPRVDDLKTVGSRFKIWSCAWMAIKDHPIFGLGPFGYSVAYKIYNGHVAPHAHNIYIDSVLSYGIVGVILIGLAIKQIGKDCLRLYKWKENEEYFALCVATIIIVLIHGIMDVTLMNLCTGVFILLMMNLSVLKEENV